MALRYTDTLARRSCSVLNGFNSVRTYQLPGAIVGQAGAVGVGSSCALGHVRLPGLQNVEGHALHGADKKDIDTANTWGMRCGYNSCATLSILYSVGLLCALESCSWRTEMVTFALSSCCSIAEVFVSRASYCDFSDATSFSNAGS